MLTVTNQCHQGKNKVQRELCVQGKGREVRVAAGPEGHSAQLIKSTAGHPGWEEQQTQGHQEVRKRQVGSDRP